jgi:hypothetical protein
MSEIIHLGEKDILPDLSEIDNLIATAESIEVRVIVKKSELLDTSVPTSKIMRGTDKTIKGTTNQTTEKDKVITKTRTPEVEKLHQAFYHYRRSHPDYNGTYEQYIENIYRKFNIKTPIDPELRKSKALTQEEKDKYNLVRRLRRRAIRQGLTLEEEPQKITHQDKKKEYRLSHRAKELGITVDELLERRRLKLEQLEREGSVAGLSSPSKPRPPRPKKEKKKDITDYIIEEQYEDYTTTDDDNEEDKESYFAGIRKPPVDLSSLDNLISTVNGVEVETLDEVEEIEIEEIAPHNKKAAKFMVIILKEIFLTNFIMFRDLFNIYDIIKMSSLSYLLRRIQVDNKVHNIPIESINIDFGIDYTYDLLQYQTSVDKDEYDRQMAELFDTIQFDTTKSFQQLTKVKFKILTDTYMKIDLQKRGDIKLNNIQLSSQNQDEDWDNWINTFKY